MDPKRFDNWTRNRALRFSRRSALKAVGTSSVAVLLPQFDVPARAQSECSLSIRAETIGGPTAPSTYNGTLQFTLESDGRFSQATFVRPGDPPRQVTGQATGRSIDFQFDLTAGERLVFAGATPEPLSTCPDTAAGLFSGPLPGDLGGWQAVAESSSSAPPLGSTSQPSLPQGASLSCPPPQTACGQNCCPGGASCTDAAQGLCVCPAGTVQCGLSCVPDCPTDRTLDLDTCTCLGPCLPEQSGCTLDSDCCGGTCTSGICFTCPGLECGDVGCIDHLTDPFNCGACGNACTGDTPFCLGGICQCIPDNEPVGSSSSSCCSKRYVQPTGLCGCANLGEWCEAGDCCNGAQCVVDGTGFKTCCLLDGQSCTVDTDCCFNSGYVPVHGCVNGVCAEK